MMRSVSMRLPQESVPARPIPAALIPLLLLVALKAVNPVGFIGGAADDSHYLDAARCIAEHGLCVPTSHWWARLPLTAPMGSMLALAGDSRFTVSLVPFAYAVATLILFVANLRFRFGRTAAVIGGCVLAWTPILSGPALQPAIDTPELCWALAALLAAQHGLERRDPRLAALAGAAFAIAVLCRPTALALAPATLIFAPRIPRDRWSLLRPAMLAFLLVLTIELAGYAVATGDPFLGWSLSLHHTRIPTSELPAGFDLSQNPLLNMAYVQAWKRSMGIEWFWPLDPLFNLLADPRIGLTLVTAGLLLLFGMSRKGDVREPLLPLLAGAAAVHFLILVFVLAIDPKPRMFLPQAALTAAIIGVLLPRLWNQGHRPVVIAALAMLAMRGIAVNYVTPGIWQAEARARQWAAAATGPLTLEPLTARVLPFPPELRVLPVHGGAADRRAVLALVAGSCASRANDYPRRDWTLARAEGFARGEPKAMRWLRARRILLEPDPPLSLCLFSPRV